MEKKCKRRIWTKEETFKLIDMYREFPALWDPKSENFKNRTLLKCAFEAIAAEFDTSPDEVRRKIHNLNTQFCQEVKKIRKRRSPLSPKGAYHCKWEYFDALQFTKWASRLKKFEENSEEDDEDTKITVDEDDDEDEETIIQAPPSPIKKAFKNKTSHKGRKRKKKLSLELDDVVSSMYMDPSTSQIDENAPLSEIAKAASTTATQTMDSNEQVKVAKRFRSCNVKISSATTNTASSFSEVCKCENLSPKGKNNIPEPDNPISATRIQSTDGTHGTAAKTDQTNSNSTKQNSIELLNSDESQDFCNLMAKKLRKYDGVTQSAIQNAIMGVFLNADLGIFDQTRHSMPSSSTQHITSQNPVYTRSLDYLRHAQNMYSSGQHHLSSPTLPPSSMTMTSAMPSLNFPTNFNALENGNCASDENFRGS